MEQRSNEWIDARRGVFTASDIWRLMGPKGLGETGMTYIKEKVAEYFGAYEDEVSSAAMRWGTTLEPDAREYYQLAFKETVSESGFILATWTDSAGCSPDGLIRSKKRGTEFKCPYNPSNHIDHLLIKSEADLKECNKKYYWQVQNCLLITGYVDWDFVSYDPRFTGDKRMGSVIIKPVEADQILLRARIEEAIKIKNEIIAKL